MSTATSAVASTVTSATEASHTGSSGRGVRHTHSAATTATRAKRDVRDGRVAGNNGSPGAARYTRGRGARFVYRGAVYFSHDYGAVTRWVREDALDAVTVEPTGRVVFSCFDTNPACFVGVIVDERPFDEVADGAAPAGRAALWTAAAERLRALRVPGATACLAVRVAAQVDARPHAWSLDGAPVSDPHVPGPAVGVLDERPALTPGGAPFVIAVRPGPHRLEGAARLTDGRASRESRFDVAVDVAPGACVSIELSRDPGDPDRVLATVSACDAPTRR